ncbi:MAG: hypothetical protein K4571_12455 [Deltaproteobacteria bacterium]
MEESKHQYIIDKIKILPEVSLPDNFTRTVMRNIEQKEKEPFFSWGRKIHLFMQSAFALPRTREDCAVSFMAVSFFYLVAAMILFFTLKDISGTSTVYDWLRLQPSLFTLVSLWLALVGAVIWAKGEKAARFAHIGSYVYILSFVFGGILLSMGGKVELLFAVILALGALFTGISLDAAVNSLAREASNKVES